MLYVIFLVLDFFELLAVYLFSLVEDRPHLKMKVLNIVVVVQQDGLAEIQYINIGYKYWRKFQHYALYHDEITLVPNPGLLLTHILILLGIHWIFSE